LNSRNLIFAWVGSVLLVAVFAGASWQSIVLKMDAGGQAIVLTGYLVFPIISALILVQASALLVSLLTPNLVGRIIAGALVPVQIWHLITASFSLESALEQGASKLISDATGVVGSGQLDLISSSSGGVLFLAYFAAVAINIFILGAKALMKLEPARKKAAIEPEEDAGSLWESQK
jgi:hypothetical protein